MIRKVLFGLLACLLALPALLAGAPRTSAQVGDPWALVAEVNALRASYGLAPLEVNSALMGAAQAHSEYQAQIGTWTHTGPGGSRPGDRAVAWGYGSGAQVYISENVAEGLDLSPHQVVFEVWQDPLHLETMISSRYRDIGAGAAFSGDRVYYTIDVGYVAGEAGDGPVSPPGEAGGTPAPTEMAIIPIQVATPRPDGSVVHVVEWGQFLIRIAEAYEVPLQDLLAHNGLNENTVIYPGDKLLIRPALTPTPSSAEGTPTPAARRSSPSPSATKQARRATRTPAATATRAAPATDPGAPPTPLAIARGAAPPQDPAPFSPAREEPAERGPDYLLIAVFVLAGAGTALVALGSALKRFA